SSGTIPLLITEADSPSTPTPTPTETPAPGVGISAVLLNSDDPTELLIEVIVLGDTSISSYLVSVVDSTSKLEKLRQRVTPPLPPRISVKATGLEPGKPYEVQIIALDKNDQTLTRSQVYGFTYQPPPTATPGPTATPLPPPSTTDVLRNNAGILLPVVGFVAAALVILLLVVLRSSRPKTEQGWQSDLTGVVMRGGPGIQEPQQIYQAPVQQGQGVNEYTNPIPLLVRPPAAITITQTRDSALVMGQRYDIAETPFRIGREGPDLKIMGDDRVSRRHAIIDYGPSGYFVEDQGST